MGAALDMATKKKYGRPPYEVPNRTPSGRAARGREETDTHAPAAVTRMIDEALRGYHDPIYGSPLGRLRLERKIDQLEFAAGKKWCDLAAAYHLATGAPSPDPHPIVIGQVSGKSADTDPDSDAGKRQAKKDRSTVNKFHEAHAIMRAHGRLAERDARALCEGIGEYPRGYEALVRVRQVLSGLAKFWQLTRR